LDLEASSDEFDVLDEDENEDNKSPIKKEVD
jgi:hypothetical protein